MAPPEGQCEGAASEGHDLEAGIFFLILLFFTFAIVFCQAPAPNNGPFLHKFPPGMARVLQQTALSSHAHLRLPVGYLLAAVRKGPAVLHILPVACYLLRCGRPWTVSPLPLPGSPASRNPSADCSPCWGAGSVQGAALVRATSGLQTRRPKGCSRSQAAERRAGLP